MSDRGPEGQDGVEPTEPPSEQDLAIILGGDPDAVTTTSHDIIKAGFDDSLADDADDISLVPAKPIASPRVGEEEHVVPRARRRWWFSRHHHRETDQSGRGADPLPWMQPEATSPSAEAEAVTQPKPKPEPSPEPQSAAKPEPRADAQPDVTTRTPPDAAPDAAPVYETRASRRAKHRD